MNEKILLIEDEEKLARFIEMELLYEGYKVEKAYDGRIGLDLALAGSFDIVILDIMLPGLNGMEVLRRIRRSSSMPVIMLTARDTTVDKVTGLDSGADDYLTKPFAIEELLARIRNALRKKVNVTMVKSLSACGLTLDIERHLAAVNNVAIELTKKEFSLLQFLLENKGIVLTRETLLEKVWGFDYTGDTNTIDVYVRYLRSKIDEPFGIKLIHTVRGVGYVIRDE
ncbi:response regulator transcription factor [Desulfoscipio gibsoniae]|uniref:Stage 0 sporulation protein A homolog n=1 Tax=Desulfoscipio gibsoniae DSM 7213 TaxID=767817 RepID=R4KAC4_9FIRM|nr:response regulator transcription factor [Desulfoscipio gibsoniae]AGL00133.1 response regulator with CheY-like receiver domain and winged-helix DNA-binding domain [Desulfoscipio gibsoniae DSM 7213]